MRCTLGKFTFCSDFDSGNLHRVEVDSIEDGNLQDQHGSNEVGVASFKLWIARDCEGGPNENECRTWFNFSVSGGKAGDLLIFTIMNMNRQVLQ